jgi:lipopolysaccharide/colanic/teichoic acid biosynthesis glycosyltransferase
MRGRQAIGVASQIAPTAEIRGAATGGFIVARSSSPRPAALACALAGKRACDVVGSALLLIALLPVMAAVAASVALTSRGPVLFRHQRVGLGGKSFELLKFRTMRAGTHEEVLADEASRAEYIANDFKLRRDDPRITAVGRWLRKTSLDELPQLVNVLRGEMALVGIRPLVPSELALRPSDDRARYVSLRPGITGLWQVLGRSTIGSVNRLELDRAYVDNWSLANDVRILVRTPSAVVRTRHTQ